MIYFILFYLLIKAIMNDELLMKCGGIHLIAVA
jgi:hypothetical protein